MILFNKFLKKSSLRAIATVFSLYTRMSQKENTEPYRPWLIAWGSSFSASQRIKQRHTVAAETETAF